MLRLEDYERIRRAVTVKGMSQREAARELGHSRKTISKALKHSSPPGYRRRAAPRRPVLGRFEAIIETWVEEDRKRPPKQRHTGTRIHQRLRDEYDFQGSVSAVRRYLASKRSRGGEVYFPLQFDPGEEAQVDWGEAWFHLNGVPTKALLFCMRLCYSKVSFVRAYRRQTQEALLDGHVRAFEFLGGVPRRTAYDNLKTVVISVGKGQERRLTKRFIELRSHYLFTTRFCNVASGNEKGHVENLVKHAQRTFMTPLPECASFNELNAHLEAWCLAELDEQPSRSDRTREDLLEEERSRFLPLPEAPFEACRRESTFATKQALVRFETNDYSVPVEQAYHPIVIKGFVDRVELWSREQSVATHPRCYERNQYVLDPHHYLPLLERKPGGLHHGRPFKGEPWGEDFSILRRELEYRYGGEGTKRFIRVLLLFAEHPVASVKEAVQMCVRRRAFSDEAVESLLHYQPHLAMPSLDLSDRPQWQVACTGIRAASEYDALLIEEAPV